MKNLEKNFCLAPILGVLIANDHFDRVYPERPACRQAGVEGLESSVKQKSAKFILRYFLQNKFCTPYNSKASFALL